jgi:hypothetical protein
LSNYLEPVRYGGDLMRAAGAGINNAFGGTPYVPEWRSGLARNAPPPADKEANLEYLKQAEAQHMRDSFFALGTYGAIRGGGKVYRKVVGRGAAAEGAAAKGAKCAPKKLPDKLVGNNPKPASGKRVNTDLTGGKTVAEKLFNDLTGGKSAVDPKSGHLVGENGVRLRIGQDGRPRVDIPAHDGVPPETIHFDP